MAQCGQALPNGELCPVAATGDGFCVSHSPALAEQRRQWNAAGGRNSAAGQGEIKDVRNEEAAWDCLAAAVAQAKALRPGADRARLLIAAAGAILAALRDSDVSKRLKALETQLAELAGARRG